MFEKNELKKFQMLLNSHHTECLEDDDEEEQRSIRNAFLKITQHFLRTMKQEKLADCLQSSKRTFHTFFLSHIFTNTYSLVICCVFIQELQLHRVSVNCSLI